ncbi:LysR family transcriptional regulator [Winslowiella iniecta]|uniref:LysR family transcriptional regulator n=1 Tax=Winslowiella iniecta TaxID=1560201 RepID=A0A0L7T6K2_9GAMM|nr:LysR family transcriptional regulator [Winslowiella iniecta]KOC91012.1 LysR family transcriptional regulator [Winslowiella iniecta]
MVVDIRILRSFSVVGELEHIGQAAEKLHISQSPLSRQIQLLENELGVELFHREKKRLRLTSEGKHFLSEVQAFLKHHDRLKDRGKNLGKGLAGRLDIGYVEAAIHSRLLPDTLARLGCTSDVDIRLYGFRSKQQIECLRDRTLDLALLHTPPATSEEFEQRKVFSEPIVLAMPKNMTLSAPQPEDLDHQPWIADQEGLNPAARARLLNACAASGFTPNIRLEVSGPLAALSCVEAGLGFTFVQKSLARISSANVSIVELPWFPLEVSIHAVWKRNDTKPLIQRILSALKDF